MLKRNKSPKRNQKAMKKTSQKLVEKKMEIVNLVAPDEKLVKSAVIKCY
jgi:hypothetical protein